MMNINKVRSIYSISKTPDLMDLVAKELPLTAYKIIDMYLAHINPLGIKDIQAEFLQELEELPAKVLDSALLKQVINTKKIERDEKIKDLATVIISKAEYCNLMGLDRRNAKKSDIIKILDRILSIRSQYISSDPAITENLFSEASFDHKTGEIQLVCNYANEAVCGIFFDTGNFPCFQYELKVAMALKSVRAYKIAMLLLKNRLVLDSKRETEWSFDIKVSELRSQIGCVEKYAEWGNFSKKILNVAKSELENSVSGLSFSYEVIDRYNHSPIKLRFTCCLNHASPALISESLWPCEIYKYFN